MLVTHREERGAFNRRKSIRRAIAPGALDECERAVIRYKMFPKEIFGCAESLREQSP